MSTENEGIRSFVSKDMASKVVVYRLATFGYIFYAIVTVVAILSDQIPYNQQLAFFGPNYSNHPLDIFLFIPFSFPAAANCFIWVKRFKNDVIAPTQESSSSAGDFYFFTILASVLFMIGWVIISFQQEAFHFIGYIFNNLDLHDLYQGFLNVVSTPEYVPQP